eukprot:3463502-Heterocapsa_arctica.AAC.1
MASRADSEGVSSPGAIRLACAEKRCLKVREVGNAAIEGRLWSRPPVLARAGSLMESSSSPRLRSTRTTLRP